MLGIWYLLSPAAQLSRSASRPQPAGSSANFQGSPLARRHKFMGTWANTVCSIPTLQYPTQGCQAILPACPSCHHPASVDVEHGPGKGSTSTSLVSSNDVYQHWRAWGMPWHRRQLWSWNKNVLVPMPRSDVHILPPYTVEASWDFFARPYALHTQSFG